jgi:hypothetical protein
LNVKSRAQAVGTFRHLNVRLMEILSAWIPGTPEMEVKVLFGRHLWLFAQAADRLGRRARELRAPLHYDRPPRPAFAAALAGLASQGETSARIEGHAVALDALQAAYDDYIARTDALIDEPTVLILQDAARDLARMRAEREKLLAQFPALRADRAAAEALRGPFRAAGAPIDAAAEPQPA